MIVKISRDTSLLHEPQELRLLVVEIWHAVNKDASVERNHQPYGVSEDTHIQP